VIDKEVYNILYSSKKIGDIVTYVAKNLDDEKKK